MSMAVTGWAETLQLAQTPSLSSIRTEAAESAVARLSALPRAGDTLSRVTSAMRADVPKPDARALASARPAKPAPAITTSKRSSAGMSKGVVLVMPARITLCP